jgi:hypothetical protein
MRILSRLIKRSSEFRSYCGLTLLTRLQPARGFGKAQDWIGDKVPVKHSEPRFSAYPGRCVLRVWQRPLVKLGSRP